MAVKLASTASNLDKERDGDAIPSTLYPGVTYRVRSIHYEPFTTARDLALQNLAKRYGEQPIPRGEMVVLMGRLYSEHLLVGWTGFDVPYSPDTATATLTDPAFRELVADVELAARKSGKQNLEFVEDLVKN